MFPFASLTDISVTQSTVSLPILSISVSLPESVSSSPVPVSSMSLLVSDLTMADADAIVDYGTVIDDVLSCLLLVRFHD